MSLLTDLVAARAGAASKLAAALSSDYSKAVEFKPDTNGGNSLNRTAYIRELRETIKDLDLQIANHQGPVNVETIGVV